MDMDDLEKVVEQWGYNTVLRELSRMLLDTRKKEDDPNVMNAFDQAAARVKGAADLLNSVGI